MSPDCELITDYATKGSEAAFRALVARHVDLVYATAFRQIGDAGIAEEITQNVFVALARKSPRLAGFETLAGWLYRTTILESKARIRAELRHKRREELAAESIMLQNSESALAQLIPLLDEALLRLDDSDRLALVLRYLEDRDLQQVGTALGVTQEAARKRVSRALDRVVQFFRRRGFASACGTTALALFTDTAKAAPSGLAASAANAGLGGGGAASGLGLVLFHLMTLTKTQTLIVCAVLASAPLAWEWKTQARIAQQQTESAADLANAARRATDLDGDLARINRQLQSTERDNVSANARLATLRAQRAGAATLPAYTWDDKSPYLRMPKEFVRNLSFYATEHRLGKMSELSKDLLQLNASETDLVEAATREFISSVYAVQSKNMRQVQPTSDDLRGRSAKDTRVFEVAALGDDLTRSKNEFCEKLDTILGSERSEILKSALQRQLPFDDKANLSSAYAWYPQAHKFRFWKPKPGEIGLGYSVDVPGGGSLTSWLQISDIPGPFQSALADWIDLMNNPGQNP